jgi:hypothetical protein
MLFSAGSLLEIHYDLMTFGIPTKLLPVTAQGEADFQHHYDWISSRKSIEATSIEAKEEQTTPCGKDDSITVPRRNDVMMGTLKVAQSHAGNRQYQNLIREYQARYDACETRIEKTIIASVIVMKVKGYGGRFLFRKKGESNWSEAAESAANEKVTNAFRGRRKTAAARFKRIIDDSTGTTSSKLSFPDPCPNQSCFIAS